MKDFTHGPAPGFWQMLWRTGGLLPLVLAAFTVILSGFSIMQLRDAIDFETRGVETVAEVTERDQKTVRRDNRDQTEYFVTVAYLVKGADLSARSKVSRRDFLAADIGSTRTIRYKRHHPQTIEFNVGETLESGRNMRFFALVSGIAALGALWWKGGRAVDAIRARKFGPSEQATVVKVIRTRHKNSTSYRLQWVDRHKQSGTSLASSDSARYDAYPVHSQIEVFRGAKGVAWWVGDVGPRASAPSVPSLGKS